jgi:tubby and related proteins
VVASKYRFLLLIYFHLFNVIHSLLTTQELGLVRFEFDSGGPSRIEAFIPSVNSVGSASTWQPSSEDHGMNARIDERQFSNLIPLVNKKPKWDDAHGGHVLNFQGRVTESSVKNFQLCPADFPSSSSGSSSDTPGTGSGVLNDDVVLQFGRVAKHKFTLDVRYPMSPMQVRNKLVAWSVYC